MPNLSLKFNELVFKEGLNSTVRLGDKWFNRFLDRDFKEPFDIVSSDGVFFAKASLQILYLMPIEDLESDVLDLERRRTHKGLIKEMSKIYGRKVKKTEEVTAIVFNIEPT